MKFLAFLFVTSLLTVLVSSLTVKASDTGAALERGNRVIASVAAGAKGHLTVAEHPADDGNLRLVLEADGKKLQNDSLISALDRDEDDVSSYNVSAKAGPGGSLVISSVKDWGNSNWSFGYTVSFRDGGYRLSHYDYKLSSRQKKGSCSLDLVSGSAVVNGRKQAFTAPASQLDLVNGIDLERICQELGMN